MQYSQSRIRNTTTTQQYETVLSLNCQSDLDQAKAVAKRIFDIYDQDNKGYINEQSVSQMLVDMYANNNRQFTPSQDDTRSYLRVFDKDKDGKISYTELEDLCFKYLIKGKGGLTSGGLTTSRSTLNQSQSFKSGVTSPDRSKIQYTPDVIKHLEVARKLFKEFDNDKSGFLDESEIPGVITETYKSIGYANYQPTRNEIKKWMSQHDQNNDGKVSIDEYEQIIIKSLEKMGIKISVSKY